MINYNSRLVPRSSLKNNRRHEYKTMMFGTAIIFMSFFIFSAMQVVLKRSVEVSDAINSKPKKGGRSRTDPVITCRKGGRSEYCEMTGDIRIDPNSPTVYYVNPPPIMASGSSSPSLTIQPYGRSQNMEAMESVTEWSVVQLSSQNSIIPQCSHVHNSPGVLFSFGGFSLNFFHGFTDVIVPLFATARPFNRDVHLLVANNQPWAVSVFQTILRALSRYNLVDIDDEQKKGGRTHCFSRLTLGLKGQGETELSINSSESTYTMADFQHFLRTTYNLNKSTTAAIKLQDAVANQNLQPPRLLIISRASTRTFTNIHEIAKLSRELGYEVTVAEPYEDTWKYAGMVNSCDVLLGVHGAGLTNMLFLPDEAVVIQVVPLMLGRISKLTFGEPSRGLKVRYLEYVIGKEESSLIDKYSAEHDVFTNPWVFREKGSSVFRSIYVENQNVTIDLSRFRPTLLKALELLHQ